MGKRLQTLRGKIGLSGFAVGASWEVSKWVLDYYGRYLLMRDFLPSILRFLSHRWVGPAIMVAGLIAFFWRRKERTPQLSESPVASSKKFPVRLSWLIYLVAGAMVVFILGLTVRVLIYKKAPTIAVATNQPSPASTLPVRQGQNVAQRPTSSIKRSPKTIPPKGPENTQPSPPENGPVAVRVEKGGKWISTDDTVYGSDGRAIENKGEINSRGLRVNPPTTLSQDCPNGICIGGDNNGTATVINPGPPPPIIHVCVSEPQVVDKSTGEVRQVFTLTSTSEVVGPAYNFEFSGPILKSTQAGSPDMAMNIGEKLSSPSSFSFRLFQAWFPGQRINFEVHSIGPVNLTGQTSMLPGEIFVFQKGDCKSGW